MKEKERSGTTIICQDCKREITLNECEIHKNSSTNCYFCHLQKEHIHEQKGDEIIG